MSFSYKSSDSSIRFVELRSSVTHGLGIFATQNIPAYERIIEFQGKEISLAEYLALDSQLQLYPHQIGEDLFFGPTSKQDVSETDYLNHSCDPNVGYHSELVVVSIRPIKRGEEILIDYGFSESLSGYEFECKCGSSKCRGKFTWEDWRKMDSNLNYIQPYLRKKMAVGK